MAVKIFKHKWHRTTVIVVSAIAVLVVAFAYLANRYWSPVLASKVKELVQKSSNGLYTADFSSAELHVLRGSIDFYNITLKPDTTVYNRMVKEHIAPNNIVELRVKRLTLSHVHPFRLYFRRRLEIGQVVLDEPVVKITYRLNHSKDTTLNTKTAWQRISKTLRSIRIGSVLLGYVKLRYDHYKGDKLHSSEFDNMNLSARNLLIDSATQYDKTRLLFCKDIVVELNNYSGTSSNGLYNYQLDHLKLSTLTSRLNIEGLKLNPIKTDSFFAKSNRDRFTLRLDSIQLNDFDFLNFHKYRVISAKSVTIQNGNFNVYGSPNHHKPATDRIVTFPNVGIYNLKADIDIDTLSFQKLDVSYSEYNARSGKTGTVSFDNTTGTALNITTRPAAVQKNNYCDMNLVSYFMHRAKLNLHARFNLADNDHSFSLDGNLGPMSLKAINPATSALAMVKVTDGDLKQMDFNINANRSASHGKIKMLYNNLKINILKPDTVIPGLKNKPIETLYANLFILKHNNPDASGEMPRSFAVSYRRSTSTPFFKFVWQTLLAGIRPSIGLDDKARQHATAMKKQNLINKQNRRIKKEQRIKRRQERRQKKQQQQNN